MDDTRIKVQPGCRTCIHLDEVTDWPGIVGQCAIQGNVNPMHFRAGDLERSQYPYGPCDEGRLGDDRACQAYRPRPEQTKEEHHVGRYT